ncbi:MAG: hypothetical protein ACOZEN_09430 [Thermodesulfobacteriota bacterium]
MLLAVGGFLAVGLSLLDGDSPLQRGVFATGVIALIIGCATFPRNKKQDVYKAPKGWDKWAAYHRKPPRPWEKKTTP